MARVLAGTARARRTLFVAFGAEEQQPGGGHHIGSQALADSLSPAERNRLRAMVSVDMVGKKETLLTGWLGLGDGSAARLLLRAARAADVPVRLLVTDDLSDNGPFEKAGVPAAFLWTGTEPNHHQPTDVVSNVDRVALRRVGAVLMGFLRRVARAQGSVPGAS